MREEEGQYDEALIYLVIGEERAAVIDGGTGIGRLDRLVMELTDKPYFLLLTHTHNDHICLLDREARYLYTGDIYYTGGVTSYLPGGNHDDFIKSCKRLVDLMPEYDYLMPAHNEPLVEPEQMREMYEAAKGIKDGSITDYTSRRSVATNYDTMIRRYQFSKFSLSVRESLFK
ncbi:hypothetical protein DRO31_00920 [Candidatus Bathyarchaeota archaeon]|nr:MAG: hypothetical protein DRO31_00920 [Candidatus Bathyarchaeota archaeon]